MDRSMSCSETEHEPIIIRMKVITVLLAEDHNVVRDGLLALLREQDDLEVIGTATNGSEAVALAGELRPEVVVMDISMPLLSGFEATRQILHAAPATFVVMLSAHAEDAYVERAMGLGASGYLLKKTAHLLPEAIREVHKGAPYFSSGVSRRFQKVAADSAPRLDC